jgi:hypothetical protein
LLGTALNSVFIAGTGLSNLYQNTLHSHLAVLLYFCSNSAIGIGLPSK